MAVIEDVLPLGTELERSYPVYVRGRLVAWLLRLKEPRFITGYSAPEMHVAFRQGEIDAQVEDPDDEEVKADFAHFHIVFNTPNEYKHPHPRFRSLPHVNEFAKTERQTKSAGIVSGL